ncbi:hypothetical protein E6W39_13145 [Kitasatospora acidiphila]|uniref:Uncharacterized protein n=1 Tax=Kitasatospora acidiphila TaxID=2567942 RepID=A0A540W1Z9_9ACTN|nr:hypothetical protein [Kitasatospora acidiphila]TQF03031.1 hypothetical protein E6W39_13145 [Kitasatospora acidiphila]
MIILGFAFPLVCWALAARTARVGWITATVLVLCAAAGIALAEEWIFVGAKVTLLLVFALATVAVLIAGIVVEGRRVGVRKLRSSGVRGVLGLILSTLYCVIGLGYILLTAFLLVVNGPLASTPSSAEVLPLPAGLAVTENREGCDSGSQTICSREIQVRSTTGLPDDAVVRQLQDHLTQTGWQLAPDTPAGSWNGCRAEGWLLDRQQVCVDVQDGQRGVSVLVETTDSW